MSDRDFPYEATFLSSFGLALGMAIGQHQVITRLQSSQPFRPDSAGRVERLTELLPEALPTDAVSVNAYSGTSNDFVYGDALVSFRDRGFIAEFKRDLDGWTAEVRPDRKPHKIRVLERVCSMKYDFDTREWGDGAGAFDAELYDRSQAAHWFVYGEKGASETEPLLVDPLDLCFAPYVCLTRGRADIESSAVRLTQFLSEAVGGHFGVPLGVLAEYLDVVRKAAEDDDGDDDDAADGAQPNGILVYFDATRRARLIWFRSIQELIRKVGVLKRSLPDYAPPVPTEDDEMQSAEQWEHPMPEPNKPKGPKR